MGRDAKIVMLKRRFEDFLTLQSCLNFCALPKKFFDSGKNEKLGVLRGRALLLCFVPDSEAGNFRFL